MQLFRRRARGNCRVGSPISCGRKAARKSQPPGVPESMFGSAAAKRNRAVPARRAILADVCESLIGAVFLDAGYIAAREVVARAWRERMLAPRRPLQDAKTALQEWAQARGRPAPAYREIGRSGPDHLPKFVIHVEIDGFAAAEGEGSSKRAAEQAAAEAFMMREGIWQLTARACRSAAMTSDPRDDAAVSSPSSARRMPASRRSSTRLLAAKYRLSRARRKRRARRCAASRSSAKRRSSSSIRPGFSRRSAGSTEPW